MKDLPPSPVAPAARTAAPFDSARHASPAQGVALALGAAAFWGLFPLVFKTVAHIEPLVVLAHRSLWSLVFVTLLMTLMGRREIFQRAFYAPRTVGVSLLSGAAVAANWGVFIWAVAHGQVLQSSLGYFISPLVSVTLGVAFLGERLRRPAWFAVALATLGVAVLVVRLGELPWVALALAFSWAVYGLIRKLSPLGSLPGLYMETLLLAPFALAFLAWWAGGEGMMAFGADTLDGALLMGTGLVTALPLLLFARATRILKLSTAGVLLYSVPTLQFLLAVYAFGEPFTLTHLAAFTLIWIGLVLYGGDSLKSRTRAG